ncbi:hypothetical protein K3495_g14261 [Podosphaera aphanis]|nr:hypothetical protein K3495_g14261 [Podosphaera aphanis]
MSNGTQSPSAEMPPSVATNNVPVSAQQPSRDEVEMASFFRDILAVGLHRGMVLNNVVRLEGPETFDAWESDMLAVWNSAGLYEIVVEGQQPIEGAVPTERRAHRVLSGFAVGVYVQVVHTDIRQRMLEKQDPHLMWLYLRSEYKKENTYSLVYQLGTFTQLVTEFDPSKPISFFVRRFEAEHYKLCRLAESSSDPYRRDFGVFLERDETKRDFLLGFLSKRLKNVVDNLTTKDNLTYSMVKQKLNDLDVNDSPPQTALYTQAAPNRQPSKSMPTGEKKKRCNYCKKHFPAQMFTHNWNKCERLKEKQSVRKDSKNAEVSNMTTHSVDKVSSPHL